MQWVVDKLLLGETVQFRPTGNSMEPLIKSKQLVTIEPYSLFESWHKLSVGDIVLSKVKGRNYLHKITALDYSNSTIRVQISNNKGYINGWTSLDKIYGVVVKVED